MIRQSLSRMTTVFIYVCLVWLAVRAVAVVGRALAWPVDGFRGADGVLGVATPALAMALLVASLFKEPAAPGRVNWALGLVLSGTFLLFDLGKILHSKEMVAFFVDSGWPGWLHWVVMAAEVGGALVLARYAGSRSGLAAGLLLFGVMAGAIFTHKRNGDPAAASFDAARQAVLLCCYVGLHPRLRGWSVGRRA